MSVTKLKRPVKLSMPMCYRVQPTAQQNALAREWRENQTWEPDREAQAKLYREVEKILGRPFPQEQVTTLAAA